MRKIRITEHISLDGVSEHDASYQNGTWTTPYRTPAGLALLVESYGPKFDVLLGRRTYDQFSNFWPNAGDNPMANGLNAATKYVATHRPDGLTWGPAKSLGADVVAGIRDLKSTDGPDLIVAGSLTLSSQLLDQELVDEVVMVVYPVLLGQGIRLMSESVAARELAFVSTKTTPAGVLLNTYRFVGPLKK